MKLVIFKSYFFEIIIILNNFDIIIILNKLVDKLNLQVDDVSLKIKTCKSKESKAFSPFF